ncbi:hypothetical protein L0Y65_00740 [Candidatus Micrarchaeota archaeon]|nr:hypothetical protein [Candidatus Micrarchaeota archaeon]
MPLKLKSSFSFGFTGTDMVPILQMQNAMFNDSVLNNYFQQSLLSESIMKRQRDMSQATLMAQAVNESASKERGSEAQMKGEKASSTSYAITYYNPELNKTEILEAKSEIKISDFTTKMVEEAVAMQSAYSIYRFIAQPLIRTEVLPWKLEEILAQREYGTPPPPPAGAAVTPVKIIVQKESEIVALKKREDAIKEAIERFVVRKEKTEQKIAEEILIIDEAVAMLRAGDEIDKVIGRLPPLSRARYILVLRKKQLGRLAIIALLLRDAQFLKTIKKKLELFTLDDLVNIYKVLRNLQKR